MLRLLSDENFNGSIVRGMLLRQPDLDLVRVQDVGLMKTEDAVILEWAAREGRILLTHDIRTVPPLAYERLNRGLPMAGVFLVPNHMDIGRAVDDVLLFALNSETDEWKDRVEYFR